MIHDASILDWRNTLRQRGGLSKKCKRWGLGGLIRSKAYFGSDVESGRLIQIDIYRLTIEFKYTECEGVLNVVVCVQLRFMLGCVRI